MDWMNWIGQQWVELDQKDLSGPNETKVDKIGPNALNWTKWNQGGINGSNRTEMLNKYYTLAFRYINVCLKWLSLRSHFKFIISQEYLFEQNLQRLKLSRGVKFVSNNLGQRLATKLVVS